MLNLSNPFSRRHFLFAPDDIAGGAGADDKDKASAEKTEQSEQSDDKSKTEGEKKFTQADLDKIVKERLEREHKKTVDAAAEAKAASEKAALAEQGKFKELAESARAEAENEKTAREKLETELRVSRMKSAFEKSASNLGLGFVNETAMDDAFEKLDVEVVGEDLKGMDEALKKLQKERPYMFKETESFDIDARQKGKESASTVNEKTIRAKKSNSLYHGM
jgi:hypothetical protein